jgi:hypothetical protein
MNCINCNDFCTLKYGSCEIYIVFTQELCLYLDEERNQSAVCPSCGSGLRPGPRDDGDGSSSSTNADEPPLPAQFTAANPRRTESRERLLEESIQRQRTVFNGTFAA